MNSKTTPHIVVVSAYFYPKVGGVENYAYHLAKHLQESRRYTVSIITSNSRGATFEKEIMDGMTVYRLPFWFKVSNTPINPIWYWQIKDIFKLEKPDIIHVHAPVPYMPDLAVSAAPNVPVVLTYHSGSMLKNKLPIDIAVRFYEDIFLRKIFTRANAIVTISQEFARKKFPEFIDKMFFIPTGVDLNRFKQTPLPDKTEIVTFVGRIEHSSSWKGIEQLLRAMVFVLKNRPTAELELVGGGDAIGHYRARARELGIGPAVIFSGPQVGPDVVAAYQRASVVVLPSVSNAEAFSITLVEAMASGRPIIGTNIGGTPQVIEEGKNGLLVPPEDPKALAEAIERILGNRTLAANLADFGAVKAQGYSWDIQTQKYADIFTKLS